MHYTLIQAIGLPIAYTFDSSYVLSQLSRNKFLYGFYLDKYVALTILALSIVIITTILTPKSKESNHIGKKTRQNYYYNIGLSLIFLFTLFVLISCLNHQIPFNDYAAYKQWANSSRARNYLQIGFWFGSILVFAAGSKKQITVAATIILIPSLVLILAGNRNDILIPLLTGLGLYVYRFKKTPISIIVVVGISIFFLSPLLVSARTGTVLNTQISSIGYTKNILAQSMTELGSQIIPVSNMFMWIDEGEGFAYGMTYLYASFASIFGSIFPHIREAYFSSSFAISGRLPSLGFAMVAEAYFNFGIIGVSLVYWAFGRYAVISENKERDTDRLVIYGFVMFMMLFLVRNSVEFSISYVWKFALLYYFEKILRLVFNRTNLKYSYQKCLSRQYNN